MNAHDVMEAYLDKKMTMVDIAKKAKCSHDKIQCVLDALGVTNRKEFRRKNHTRKQKVHFKNISALGTAARKKMSPGEKKWRYWIKHRGKIYVPIYEDVVKGMTMQAACKKHGVLYMVAARHFTKYQRLTGRYLDWGQKNKVILRVSKMRIKQWEKAAQASGNNVLDWAMAQINAAADAHAGS